MIGSNNLKIENFNLPEGFTTKGTLIYSSREEIKTPYLYANNDYVYLYVSKNSDGKFTITDYGDLAETLDYEIEPINHELILKVLDEKRIGYEVRVQYFDDVVVKELQYINHIVQNDDDLNSDLVKIAKTLSELTNEFRH